ncbi:DNA polymerase III subunit delta' [Luteimonas pelagia]
MTTASDTLAPWQRRFRDQAVAALDAGRLGHAMLLCGEPRLGKRRVAERLAQRVLCTGHGGRPDPCGACRSCRLFSARAQRDPEETRPDGSPAHPDGHPSHPDVSFVGYAWSEKSPSKQQTQIVVDQVRGLSERLSRTSQFGGAQVAIIEPADALNAAAANALLKTLEEPVPGRYLWLVTAHPARLPATIRSRCQRFDLRMPDGDEALGWLRARGHAPDAARDALDAARGHPGLADAWLRDGGLRLRQEVERDLASIAAGGDALETARRWVADTQADSRLMHAAALAHVAALRLTDARRRRTLATWFDAANRARDLLRTTVRADLTVAGLLLEWPRAAGAPVRRGAGGTR